MSDAQPEAQPEAQEAAQEVALRAGSLCDFAQSECCPAGYTERTLDNQVNVVSATASQCVVALGGSDVISGGGVVLGGLGEDNIFTGNGAKVRGGEGNDTINVYEGATVYGNAGNDTLNAANGNNTIIPGPGIDTVAAGVGNDKVYIYDLCEVGPGEKLEAGTGIDTIYSPVSINSLRALGVTVKGFEHEVIEHHACASECVEGTKCGGHGTCTEDGSQSGFHCECESPFAGPECTQCEYPFEGVNCDQCAGNHNGVDCKECNGNWTGPQCNVCEYPYTGPNCEGCQGNHTGPACKSCNWPFRGEQCNECEAPWTGPMCDQCPPGTSGPACNVCDPSDPAACNGNGSCVPGDAQTPSRCDCNSGFVGPECGSTVHDISILDNEGPDTFDLHKLPNAEDLGDHFNSNTIPFTLIPMNGSCQWLYSLEVDEAGEVNVGYSNGALDNPWELIVVGPTGTNMEFVDVEDQGNHDLVLPISGHMATFDAPQPGIYQVRVRAPVDCDLLPTKDGELSTAADDSHRVLYVTPTSNALIDGNTVGVQVRLYDPQLVGQTTAAAQDVAPSPHVTDEIAAASLILMPPGQPDRTPMPMFDDGLHDDHSAHDGIFGATFPVSAGNWAYRVEVEARRPGVGVSYLRSGYGGMEVAAETVEFYRPYYAEFLPPENGGRRARVVIALKDATGLVDENGDGVDDDEQALERLAAQEVDLSAELWVRSEGTPAQDATPIAWAVGLRMVSVKQLGADDLLFTLKVGLEFDWRWLANAGVFGTLGDLDDLRLELRNVTMLDAKTTALRDFAEIMPLTPRDGALEWLASLDPSKVFDPSLPENEDMLTGAPPEFVQDIRDSFSEASFPSARGQVYLTSGWCGGPGMWLTGERSATGIVYPFLTDPAGNAFTDRLIHATDLWFNPTADGPAEQVHVRQFADAIVESLRERPDVAEIWGFSQGGVAALEARRRWTPLDGNKRAGSIAVRGLAAEFYGTPFAARLRGIPRLGRAVARYFTMSRCKAGVNLSEDYKNNFIGLGRPESHRRMSRTPTRLLDGVQYHATKHKTSGRKKRCNFWLSKVYLWGDDDGIVQSKNAIIWKHARGVDDWKPYCHDAGYPFLHDFSGREQTIYNVMCNDSFLYELGACRAD